MAIITQATAKSLLNISTAVTTYDAWITALIPQVEEDYVNIRGKAFEVGTKINFTSSAALPADGEMTITVGNWVEVGSTAEGTEYDIILRSGDTMKVVARRVLNQIEPSPYYTVTAPLTGATSSSADVYLQERFEKWSEDFSVLDLSVATPTGSGITATVSKMQVMYPDGAEFTAAKMIQFHMNALQHEGVQSESLGDYSVTYRTESKSADYPKPIVSGIRRYVRTL